MEEEIKDTIKVIQDIFDFLKKVTDKSLEKEKFALVKRIEAKLFRTQSLVQTFDGNDKKDEGDDVYDDVASTKDLDYDDVEVPDKENQKKETNENENSKNKLKKHLKIASSAVGSKISSLARNAQQNVPNKTSAFKSKFEGLKVMSRLKPAQSNDQKNKRVPSDDESIYDDTASVAPDDEYVDVEVEQDGDDEYDDVAEKSASCEDKKSTTERESMEEEDSIYEDTDSIRDDKPKDIIKKEKVSSTETGAKGKFKNQLKSASNTVGSKFTNLTSHVPKGNPMKNLKINERFKKLKGGRNYEKQSGDPASEEDNVYVNTGELDTGTKTPPSQRSGNQGDDEENVYVNSNVVVDGDNGNLQNSASNSPKSMPRKHRNVLTSAKTLLKSSSSNKTLPLTKGQKSQNDSVNWKSFTLPRSSTKSEASQLKTSLSHAGQSNTSITDAVEIIEPDELSASDEEHLYAEVSSSELYQGMWDCKADEKDELPFKRGQIVRVTSKEHDKEGWWIGQRGKQVGFVPKKYLMSAYEE